MNLFDYQELKQMRTPTKKEMLKEAHAWGYDTAEEFHKAMDEAIMEEHNDD